MTRFSMDGALACIAIYNAEDACCIETNNYRRLIRNKKEHRPPFSDIPISKESRDWFHQTVLLYFSFFLFLWKRKLWRWSFVWSWCWLFWEPLPYKEQSQETRRRTPWKCLPGNRRLCVVSVPLVHWWPLFVFIISFYLRIVSHGNWNEI